MNSKQIETSLLTEHLRHTPLTIIDDIINTVNLLIERAVDAVESGLLSTDPENLGFAAKAVAENRTPETDEDGQPAYPEMRVEVEEGVHQLETLLAANVDRNFDKFEIFALRNIFAIDADLVPWVRLGHYDGVDIQALSAPDAPTVESIRIERRKIQETRKLNNALLAERARNEKLLNQLRAMTTSQPIKSEPSSPQKDTSAPPPDFSFLTSTSSAHSLGLRPLSSDTKTTPQSKATPLATNTSFTLSQLPSLKALVEELRPNIATLKTIDVSAGQDRFTRERSEYVEMQTMRILESRGVDLHDASNVGQITSSGRRVGREEVEALERIIAVVGNKRAQAGNEEQDDTGSASDEDAMEE